MPVPVSFPLELEMMEVVPISTAVLDVSDAFTIEEAFEVVELVNVEFKSVVLVTKVVFVVLSQQAKRRQERNRRQRRGDIGIDDIDRCLQDD